MKQPDLGLKIIELRQSKGLTQDELVKQCNLSIRTLQRIESGEVIPRGYTLKLIANALDFDFFDLTQNDSLNQKSKAKKSLKWRHFLEKLMDLFNLKTNTMRKLTILSLPVILTTILILTINSDANARNKKIHKKDLIGTWQCCGLDSIPENIDGNVSYKQISTNTITMSTINLSENLIVSSFCASYTLEKNILTEFIEYTDNGHWHKFLGKKNAFKIRIEGDLMFKEGVNNPYKEIWKRVDEI